jgi:hypothetical protein
MRFSGCVAAADECGLVFDEGVSGRSADRTFPGHRFFDVPADRAEIIEYFFRLVKIVKCFFIEFCMNGFASWRT